MPMETMEFFATIITSRNFGIVTAIEYQEEPVIFTITRDRKKLNSGVRVGWAGFCSFLSKLELGKGQL
jgi:hypothetical protein